MHHSGLELIEFKTNLLKQAQECYRRRDIQGLLSKIDALEANSHETLDINDRTKLDYETAMVVSMAADALLDDLEFEPCFNLCNDAISTLKASEQDCRNSGIEPRPHSLAWLSVINTLADAKWKYLIDKHDGVFSFSDSKDKFASSAARVLESLNSIADDSTRHQRLHSILWCGIMLVKQAFRFDPDSAGSIELIMETALPASTRNLDLPYSWDRRIARLWLSGRLTVQTAKDLYAKRLDCILNTLSSSDTLDAYRKSADKEMRYLLVTRDSFNLGLELN